MTTYSDLESCDREPVRTIGAIQPHGLFYACDVTNFQITHMSANTPDVIGQPLQAVLGEEVAKQAQAFVQSTRSRASTKTIFGGTGWNVVIHRLGDKLLALELEPVAGDNPPLTTIDIQRTVDKIKSIEQPLEMLHTLVQSIRALTGYDRVMAYRFDEEWNGEVVVDERRDDMDSWLHFRYPPSDIPAPARELFTKNWSRIIPTVVYDLVPIMPKAEPDSKHALDLTYSTLRAPSPIHVEYLRNMQVGGSFTLSLIANGRLWGMIACHHRTPYFVDFPSREAGELLAMAASAQISKWEDKETQDLNQRMKLVRGWLQGSQNPTEVLIDHSKELLELTNSQGVALVKVDEVVRLGECPDEDEVRKIADDLKHLSTPVFTTRSIVHVIPSATCATGRCAGVMVVKVTRRFEDEFILWFRPEQVEEVIWGGDPSKNISEKDGRIHPRKSFLAWKETVRNTSTPWDRMAMAFAEQLSQAITEADRASLNRK